MQPPASVSLSHYPRYLSYHQIIRYHLFATGGVWEPACARQRACASRVCVCVCLHIRCEVWCIDDKPFFHSRYGTCGRCCVPTPAVPPLVVASVPAVRTVRAALAILAGCAVRAIRFLSPRSLVRWRFWRGEGREGRMGCALRTLHFTLYILEFTWYLRTIYALLCTAYCMLRHPSRKGCQGCMGREGAVCCTCSDVSEPTGQKFVRYLSRERRREEAKCLSLFGSTLSPFLS
jgi:hypothetical protein